MKDIPKLTGEFDPPVVLRETNIIYIYSYGQIWERERVVCARTNLHG